jgi:peptidoglycan/xylan/chitin deacetylase (PgdA/CDA1 family)
LRFSLVPFFIRETLQRHNVTFLVYHDITPEIADKHFRVLKKFYTIISLSDFLRARTDGTSGTLPPKSLVITFDDGHKGNYLLKPVLEKHNIPVVIFLCSAIVGTNRHFWWQHPAIRNIKSLKTRPDEERLKILGDLGFDETREYEDPQGLTKEEIASLAGSPLVNLQSHTLTHPCLPQCSDDKAFHEISDSKRDLETSYSLDIYALAYPNGDYTEREIALLRKSGYLCGLTCDPGFNDAATPLYELRRLSMNSNSDTSELLVRASGSWAFLKDLMGIDTFS